MARPGRGMRMPQKTHEKKSVIFGKIIRYTFGHYKLYSILILITLAIVTLASVSSSILLKMIIDDCIMPAIEEGKDTGKALMGIIITMASIYSLAVLSSLLNGQLTAKVTQGTLNYLRQDMFNHMEKLPVKYFDTHTHGDIMSKYTNDVDTLRQLISQSIPQIIAGSVTIIGLLGVMLTYSVWLTLIVLLACVGMMFNVAKVGGNSAKYFMKQQVSLGKAEGFIEEIMHGEKVVKVFCHETEAEKDFDVLNEELYNDAYQANKFGNILMPIMGNIGNILYVLLALVGAILAFTHSINVSLTGLGVMTIGIIISFLGMGKSFTMNVSQLSQQINSVAMGLAGAERIFDLINEKEEEDKGYVTLVNVEEEAGAIKETNLHTNKWAWRHPHQASGEVTYTPLKGHIVMEDVDFAYNPDKVVLHDIKLYAEPGQKVAFVGATGAGKTTITNLINRFYDLADGKVRYDGININKIKKDDLRRSLGIVLQDTNLFTGTVMENIRYGRLDATDSEVIDAAKLANAHDFISRLPIGYQTLLTSDGSNLSQGQRQLLSIARAAVANPPVMILDEATSSIDTRTELLVQKGMDGLMEGRTVFVIAHRLSTVQNSDVIMVLEQGRIIERGSHQELIAKKGKYYQLYTGAFELE